MKSGSLNGELCARSFKAWSLIFDLDVFDYMTLAYKARKLGRPHSERRQSQRYGEYEKGTSRNKVLLRS
jgi:hypothetical protein